MARTTSLKYDFAVDPNPAVDDVTLGYQVGDVWENTVSGILFICTDNTDTAAVWDNLTDAVGTGSAAGKEMKFAFATEAARANTAGYTDVARFGWDGSTVLGTPTSIKAIAYTSATSYDIRVYDITNSLVIAELTGETDGTPTIIDLGALTNVSAASAIWEVQMLRSGGGFAELDSISVKFT